jgi:hypothetical protein
MGLFPKLLTYSIGLTAAVVICSSAAFAKVTLLKDPTGVSAFIKTTTGTTTPTVTTTIYAGFAGTCATTDGFSTCDSCGAAVPIVDGGGITFTTSPCNFKNAYPNLKLHIELTVSNAAVTGTPTLFLEIKSTSIAGSATMVYTGTTLSVDIPWSAVCNGAGGGADCTTADIAYELEIGIKSVGGVSGTNDTMTIPIKTRALSVVNNATNVTTAWFYTDCPPGTVGTTSQGFCHFKAYKGDSKVYADELGVPAGYPATGTGINYTGIVFFYEKQLPSDADDAATLARVTTKSPHTSIAVNTTLSPPASDNRVTGLENGTTYCFVMANQDASGVLSYFTPTQTTTPASITPTSVCGTPEKVVGLLDDKSCFIATAAFGSDMAPEVQSFRDFRNKYLFTSSAGKEFVRIYYKYSPFYANLIAQNDVARATIRVALWPLLLFAKVSVNFGLWAGILLMVSSAGLVVLASRRVLRRNRNPDIRGLA